MLLSIKMSLHILIPHYELLLSWNVLLLSMVWLYSSAWWLHLCTALLWSEVQIHCSLSYDYWISRSHNFRRSLSTQGALIKLKNDQMEIHKSWLFICRTCCSLNKAQKNLTPTWQNETERCIQEVKKRVDIFMDHSGCKNYLWVMCSLCAVYLRNLFFLPV